jgi:hypothetical protein
VFSWPGTTGTLLVIPIFALYDYSFRPNDIPFEQAVKWAAENGILATGEILLNTDPYGTCADWCHSRVQETESRLEKALQNPDHTTIPILHFLLRYCDAVLPDIPRFSIWCCTRLTENWISRFRARLCVTGHQEHKDRRRLPLRRSVAGLSCRLGAMSRPRCQPPALGCSRSALKFSGSTCVPTSSPSRSTPLHSDLRSRPHSGQPYCFNIEKAFTPEAQRDF